MDHTAFIKTLAPETRAAFNQPSNAAGLRHLALHLGLIALAGTAIALRIPLWWLLLPVQGVLLVFLFTLEHECTHNTPFKSRWLNTLAGHASGLVLLLPFTWFRYFHLAHHKFTNDPARDPELAHPPIQSRTQWLRHISGLPYWAAQIRLIFRLARGADSAPYLPSGAKPRMQAEALIMLALYTLTLASLIFTPLLFWVWILPALIGQPALRLYLLAEHGDCPQVANMLLNTRTTFTTRIMRFLAWNMPYHAEHHTLPQVPFYQLPRLHRLMRNHLGTTANGYGEFTRAYLARRKP